MELTYSYMKKLGTFGRQPMFCYQGPEMCDSIPTDKREHANYVLRNPVHSAVQNIAPSSQCTINTERVILTDSGANHSEGGWPKDVNVLDPEATQRYRRREEKDEDYIRAVLNLCPKLEHYILQNNAVDMYCLYYSDMAPVAHGERVGLRTVNEYRDRLQRPVSAVSWQPEDGRRLAVAYTRVDFYRASDRPLGALLWDVENASAPELELKPSSPMFDLQFNPRDANILAGGLASGQLAVWDQRAGGEAVRVSEKHVAHRDLVRCVQFTHSKSNMEAFTGSPDGALKWWDLRRLDEPTDELVVDPGRSQSHEPSMARALAVSALEYEPTIPTRFMVGTDTGLVIGGNRKGKNAADKLPYQFAAHLGPVMSIQRHPVFMKNFLTVGDYSARIWSEECRESSILWSPMMRERVSCGEWSPTRLSLVLLSGGDGRVQLWDLLRSQVAPVLTVHVAHHPLTTMRCHEKGSLVAVGSGGGTLYLTELAPDLTDSGAHDKTLLSTILERETKRERILEARQREIRLRQRQGEEGSPSASATELPADDRDAALTDLTNDYFAQVRKLAAQF